jgi:hypothetical protein
LPIGSFEKPPKEEGNCKPEQQLKWMIKTELIIVKRAKWPMHLEAIVILCIEKLDNQIWRHSSISCRDIPATSLSHERHHR